MIETMGERSSATGDTPPIEVYEAVAARRLQFDNLVWQVPVLSLTAQAFLFTIALSAGNRQLARLIASGLALIAALLSMQLMSRHRQAEIFDAHWLAEYEGEHFGTEPPHGKGWAERRRRAPVHGRRWHEPFAKVGGYEAWMAGFAIFALAAIGVFVVALVKPDAL
jgi:hypothetical protein